MKKISIPIILLCVCLLGCTKESTSPLPLKVIKVSGARFLTEDVPPVKPIYALFACTTVVDGDTLAGTSCQRAKGNTCSTLGGCVPIPTDIQSGLYTRGEIDLKINLVEKAYGIKYVY